MFLQVLLEGVLLRDDSRIVVVVQIDIIVLQRVIVRRRMIRRRRRRHRSNAAFILSVLRVVQLLVIEIVQREISGMLMTRWWIHGTASVTRAER